MIKRGLQISVVGKGPSATSVTQALGRLSGVLQVTQADQPTPGCDLVVEMVGGVEPAFRLAMETLGRGIACVVTSPMLMAAHGRVLTAAAVGQHTLLGVSPLAFALPVDELLASGRVQRIQARFGTGAQAIMTRMGYRAEPYAKAEAELRLQGHDMTDAGGKLTQARALCMLGVWQGVWPKISASVRVGMDAFRPEDFKNLRLFGLQPVYGADVSAHGAYTGPLAVAPGHPLLQGPERDVLVLDTADGELVLQAPADEEARIIQGVLADVRGWMRRKPMHGVVHTAANVQDFFGKASSELCYVRVPYGQREMASAGAHDVVQERVEGDGFWQGVLKGADVRELRLRLPEAVVMPLVGSWEAPAQGLRLVG